MLPFVKYVFLHKTQNIDLHIERATTIEYITTIDVKRQTRTFYARANLLIRNFRHCTDKVKC